MMPSLFQLIDVLLVVTAALGAPSGNDAFAAAGDMRFAAVCLDAALVLAVFPWFSVYRAWREQPLAALVVRVLAAWTLAQTLTFAVVVALGGASAVPRQWFAGWSVLAALALVAARIAVRRVPSVRASGRHGKPIAIAAGRAEGRRIVKRIALGAQPGFRPVIVFDAQCVERTEVFGVPVVGRLEPFLDALRRQRVRELWIVAQPGETPLIEPFVDALRNDFIDIRFIPELDRLPFANGGVTELLGLPVINVVTSPLRDWQRLPKAVFDRLFALAVLIACAPLLAAIACAVKLSSPGPVFFRQRRMGVDGRDFRIYKFRSMRLHADEPGRVTQATKGDPRITKIGAFLRRTSLDELPQFINVLKGEMSVVGPRPHATEHDELYKNLVRNYMYRYRIKPGITGWAQVNGFRGETDRVDKMERRVEFDLYYIRHWNFWFDLKIVFLTLLRGFTGPAAY
ncbi:undecaprenyl-phosphate glucose phosphotransferase [Burkholderia singularis]|uniref:Undecaprenyl-phosphate galactosephosphotransferase n=1 Tax=Burkholderia singularis TaxID=1503053 RepID=A0A238H8J0_9BURK|nr:undecaprenyl-phosphate glucose phosphotransferase [Burkholderia singularis]SMG01598.1 Undecaprenyl-phosphate galactosephosphotransferase [Burkholderia singularis]